MSKKIVIYAEGGLNLGMGNIYRSISLAKAILLQENKLNITFVTSSPQYIVDKIIENGFDCIKTDKIKETISEHKPKLLIIDFLNIEAQFVKHIKTLSGCKVAIIGNLNQANHEAELVVNAIIGTNFINSQSVDQYETLYLKGPKYLVLRDEFENNRNQYTYSGKLKNVLLLFGGSDAKNHTCNSIEKLLNNFHVSAVVGSGFKYNQELELFADKITIYRNINNVAEVMLKNDFLITSPGTALFEAFCVGVPAISIFQNQSQRDVFGNFITTNNIEDINLVEKMEQVYRNYFSYKTEIDKLQIGLGKKIIIDNLIKLI